ncbi:heme A synthase [Donghicola sp. C2-DW-16]|uniref:Heme A synthase n=1 Tax=Donghicola mangrovi TaxID=2729614 RepID=A0ABX2PEA1_9RHOB|nr:heme A synthase [Donghicola mangrovi]NVO27803.1 heme A synthase [Donghicola mangrovi]
MSGKRSIFEEVESKEAVQASAGAVGAIDRTRRGARGAVRAWLALLFVMVMAMIAVGGLTRLTDSGLSITEWKPVTGALPPMDEASWMAEFEKYQQIPEYQLQNQGMTLPEFKSIYWWEWGHRQLGRTIGLVWALGFLGFAVTRSIPPGWAGRLAFVGVLGGIQGAIGWWMVSSGLSGEMLDVASYRLATHLGIAFVILGFIAWYMFELGREPRDLLQARRGGEKKLFGLSTGLLHFAFLQILLGALVAGIDAGRNYPDWPLMAGSFTPPDMLSLEPVWRNFFENDGTVQFVHRMSGYLLFIFGIVVFLKGRKSVYPKTRGAFTVVMSMLVLQMLLGIVTVMHSSPWYLAILHQVGAVCLWVLILRARFMTRYPVATSVREGL